MATVFFISHPEVAVDPGRPVPLWSLSEKGAARMASFAAAPTTAGVAAVWSSAETKAVEAAAILAEARGVAPRVHEPLHENDRSATGFLPPPEFEAMADAFFGRPQESVRGWERAVDAQERIATAVDHVLALTPGGDVAVVAHGGVGTLLLCRYLGEPIDRRRDQPFQGHWWSFDRATRRVLNAWTPIAPRL
ncbi:histidine phosphatase family protein [uncultured Alsobacter sp.]|uniref:histidine phosphatase family protein n=1 Tax=uncultured Alsobacter sp. TaxID=1748258 RepID=UPI0025DA7D7E|nr:histidine phosphatase family protein [uncultured Alsobacter sp.]